MKRLLLILTLVLVALGSSNAAEPVVNRLKDGSTVVFFGDSITDMGTYPAMMQLFYAFHGQDVTVLNAGVGGNTAAIALKRLNEDVIRRKPDLVFVMFGMNDVGRHTYKDDKQLKQREFFLNNYQKNMTELVKKLKDANLKPILMTPSPYAENCTAAKNPADKGINSEGLTKCAAMVRVLGKAENVPVIELHSVITALQDKHPDLAFSGTDRVHPMDFGALAIASLIAQSIEGLDMVSELTISKSGANGTDASATNVTYGASGVTFTYAPKNLPWPNNDNYKALDKAMDLTNSINREILIVKDLPAGEYTVSVKGKKLGSFSAEALSKGINLATLNTPEQQLALKLSYATNNLKNLYRPATKLSGARQNIDGDTKDQAAVDASFKKWIDTANNEKARTFREDIRDYYLANADKAESFDNAVQQAVKKLIADVKVAPYEIKISK